MGAGIAALLAGRGIGVRLKDVSVEALQRGLQRAAADLGGRRKRGRPPAPITQTVLPTSTAAVRVTAPKPVVMPQPIRHALSSGISGMTFTTPF